MKRRLPLGTLLLLKAILVAGCGCQEDQAAPPTAEVETTPLAAAAAIDKAHNLLNMRQPEEAELILKEALEVAPNHAQLNNLLGAALVELSRFAEAEVRFRRATELDPTLADPLARLGWLLYEKQGKAIEAKALLQQSLELDPDHERGRYTLGLVHQREGELDSAAAVYASLLERIPSAEAHRQLGLTYLQQGNLERAQRSLQEAARWSPYDPQTLVGLGQAMARQGKADSARLILKGAERIRQEEEELRPLRDAATRHPNRPQSHFNLGVAYARMGRLKLAQQAHRRALETDPSYGRAYKGLGTLAMSVGELEQAEGLFAEALARDSTLATAHNNLGLIYHARGRHTEAVAQFEAAARDAPKQAPLWANVARAYSDLGQAEQTRRAAAKALAIDSTLHGAREILGDAYFLDGALEKALANWRRVAETTPSDTALGAKIERAERALESRSR
ncbi:MAG: tetratricopeptide repeat protein [Gemmatimonadetes bacterium]|nr:tetratricopeptide repeat protein [Gemmatimonadota bacterium]